MSNKVIELITLKRHDGMYLKSIEEIDDIIIISYTPNSEESFFVKIEQITDFLNHLEEAYPDFPVQDFELVTARHIIK